MFCISFTDSPAGPNPGPEKIISDTDNIVKMDTVEISAFTGDIYNLAFSFTVDSFNRYDSDGFVYVPLINTNAPIRFLNEPSISFDTLYYDRYLAGRHTIEIISARASSGEYYYFACLSHTDIDFYSFRADPDGGSRSLRIEWSSIISQSNFNIPLGRNSVLTKIIISTDWDRLLVQPTIGTGNKENRILIEYPKDFSPNRRTYAYAGKFAPNSTLQLELGQRRVLPKSFGSTILLYSFCTIGIAFLVLVYQKQRRDFRKFDDLLAKEIDRKKEAQAKATQEEIDFSKHQWEEFGERKNDIFFFEIFYLRRKLDEERLRNKSFLEKEFPEMKEKTEWRSFYLKQQFQKYLFPILIFVIALIFLLLLSISGFSQTLKKPTIFVDDLTMGLDLSFDANMKLTMNSTFRFLVCSSLDQKKNRDTVTIRFDKKENLIDFSKVSYQPPHIDYPPMIHGDGTSICFTSRQAKKVSGGLLHFISQRGSDAQEVSSSANSNESDKYFTVSIPFTKMDYKNCSYTDTADFGYHFHSFPFDVDTIDIPISFGQYTFLKGVDIEKLDKFIAEPSVSLAKSQFREGPANYRLAVDKAMRIDPGQACVIKVAIKRSMSTRIFLPILIVLTVLLSLFVSKFPKNRVVKVLIAMGAEGALFVLYDKITNVVYEGIPNALGFQDIFNWCDIMFAVALILTLIIRLRWHEDLSQD